MFGKSAPSTVQVNVKFWPANTVALLGVTSTVMFGTMKIERGSIHTHFLALCKPFTSHTDTGGAVRADPVHSHPTGVGALMGLLQGTEAQGAGVGGGALSSISDAPDISICEHSTVLEPLEGD